MVCTLGNFSTKLLRGDPTTGITRLHGREEIRRIGPRRVRLYPIYHPAAALYTPQMLDDAARRLPPPPRSCWRSIRPSSRSPSQSPSRWSRSRRSSARSSPSPSAARPAQLGLF